MLLNQDSCMNILTFQIKPFSFSYKIIPFIASLVEWESSVKGVCFLPNFPPLWIFVLFYFQLECCGSHNYTDWKKTYWGKEWIIDHENDPNVTYHNDPYPTSCCRGGQCNYTLSPTDNSTTLFQNVSIFKEISYSFRGHTCHGLNKRGSRYLLISTFHWMCHMFLNIIFN